MLLLRRSRWASRSLTGALLILTVGLCQSCEQRPFTGYLANHSAELMNLTVPVGATNVNQEGVKRTAWSESCFWEFEANLDRAQYAQWVINKLKGEFNLVKSSGDSLAFTSVH